MPGNISHSWLALGDSYTIGEALPLYENYPYQCVQLLRKAGLPFSAPEIIARTGWTTGELEQGIGQTILQASYDIVSLLIGVNNQYRGREVENYRDEFRALLARAIALAGHRAQRVVVVSIPDWGVTRFGRESGRDPAQIARELDEYNAANARIAAALGVRYADVAPAARAGGADPDQLAADGLHPSAAMYRRWLDAVLPAARMALASP